MQWRRLDLVAVLVLTALGTPAGAESNGLAVYQSACAACHGSDRLGGIGPALLPESLDRLRPPQAREVVVKGRLATQMPAFETQLAPAEIDAVIAEIYKPAPAGLTWTVEEIAASRIEHAAMKDLPTAPTNAANPLNLFVVVESGDHHVTVLDGDRFAPLARFPSRYALHGGPKFSPDGRFVYFASRDGWISKYDLWSLTLVSEVRAGINTRNAALSGDGKWVAVANYLPPSVVLLDAYSLKPVKVMLADDARHKTRSRVSAVYQAAPRNSFLLALKDVPELWEVSTDPAAGPVFGGLVHSHETGATEAIASSSGLFALRRIEVDAPLDDFQFDPDYRALLGSSRALNGAIVVNLTVGRTVGRLPLDGLPHLASGISWQRGETRVMAMPVLGKPEIAVVDTADWTLVRKIATPGPGFFLRSHENTNYAWTDSMMGKERDGIHIIDKRSLELVRTLVPSPGKIAAHVEFTRDGRFALVSVWEMDGAIVIYDAETFAEVKRLPMVKPSGKYNVQNKITRSEGTSH